MIKEKEIVIDRDTFEKLSWEESKQLLISTYKNESVPVRTFANLLHKPKGYVIKLAEQGVVGCKAGAAIHIPLPALINYMEGLRGDGMTIRIHSDTPPEVFKGLSEIFKRFSEQKIKGA